jgi:HK97 family phage major capsid protein
MELGELEGLLTKQAESIRINTIQEVEKKGFLTKSELDDFEKNLGEKLDGKFKDLKNNQIVQDMSLKAQVSNFIAKNASEIQKAYKGGGAIEFELDTKAVGDITTANGTLPAALPALLGAQIADMNNVSLRSGDLLGLFNVVPTDQAVYPYNEVFAGEGDFLEVAQGVAKPQIDLDWTTRYASPFKIAAWERLTEEVAKDIPRLQAIATDYLFKRHNLKKQKLLLNGNGDGISTIKGANAYATLYAGAGALALGVKTPNFMDVANAMITNVYTTPNYTDELPYMPNIVLVNPADFFLQLVSAKDTTGQPLFPTASLFNQVNIGGVSIIPNIDVTAGEIKCYDLKKYNITNYVGYNVKIGWVNDDFIKNQFVILGESRFHAFVKNLDTKAFTKGVIATIKTAITAP